MAKTNLNDFDKIIVLDFGSQYNQLITRRIRDFGIYSELLPHDLSIEKIKEMAPKGIIFSGGPNSVYDKSALKVDPEIFKLGIPILGICYGMQLMSYDLGGKVEKADNSEYGRAAIEAAKMTAMILAVVVGIDLLMVHFKYWSDKFSLENLVKFELNKSQACENLSDQYLK